jgi:hypothetical protein
MRRREYIIHIQGITLTGIIIEGVFGVRTWVTGIRIVEATTTDGGIGTVASGKRSNLTESQIIEIFA